MKRSIMSKSSSKKTKTKEKEALHGVSGTSWPAWIICGAKGGLATLDPGKITCSECATKKYNIQDKAIANRKTMKSAYTHGRFY